MSAQEASVATQDGGHAELMDGVYRWQRHIYDLTRKYYLLGRDGLIAGLDVPPGGTVLELGCGTGRNLLLAARCYRQSRLFGLDISNEMLETARVALAREMLSGRVSVARGDATDFERAAAVVRSERGTHDAVRTAAQSANKPSISVVSTLPVPFVATTDDDDRSSAYRSQ